MKISVLIPVYNEEHSLATVLDQILAQALEGHELEIIVCDDGSTDGTAQVLDPYLVRHSNIQNSSSGVNHGKASAIRRGLSQASGEVVLVQDGDLEYSPADYPRLIRPLADNQTDVVYGSRFLDHRWPRGMRPQYWLANRLFTHTANFLFGGNITDEGTGYKLFRRELLESLQLSSTGFEFCAEVTAKLLRAGIKIAEVPVSYRARSRREGKKPGVLDGLRILWTLVRLRLARRDERRPTFSAE
jgi:glycosyltransferase involved in cell wall biosynthesis